MSHLTSEQRYAISVMYSAGHTQSFIANALDRDKSVISREIRRNCDGRSKKYNADLAQRKCDRRHREKNKRIKLTAEMRSFIIEKLSDKFSPEQIVGYCKNHKIDCVSHEWIYNMIWSDKKRGGKLCKHLRSRGKPYKKRGKSKFINHVIRKPIKERPLIVEKRSRFGDLEIDTVLGKHKKAAIVTINDRATGVVKIGKVSSRKSEFVTDKTIQLLKPWKGLIKTITADNGREFMSFQTIEQQLEVNFYFAEPYKSWQRASNENLNGLIRQYFPKGTDFDYISEQNIKFVEQQLNQRPRKRFGYKTPNQMFNRKVAFMT